MNKHALLYRPVHFFFLIFELFLFWIIFHMHLLYVEQHPYESWAKDQSLRCHVDSCSNVTLSDLFKWVYRHRGKSTKWKYLAVCFPSVFSHMEKKNSMALCLHAPRLEQPPSWNSYYIAEAMNEFSHQSWSYLMSNMKCHKKYMPNEGF